MTRPHHQGDQGIADDRTVFVQHPKHRRLSAQAQKQENECINGQAKCNLYSTFYDSFDRLEQHKSHSHAQGEQEKMQQVIDKACPTHA